MSDYHNNKPFKLTKSGIAKKVIGTVTDFFKSRGKKVYPDIKSVKATTNIAGSVDTTKRAAGLKNLKNVQSLKTKKETGKKMFKEAQQELRRAAETKRATKIGKDYFGRSVPADKADLRNEASAKAFKIGKGKDLEKKAKGGRVGLKRGTGLMNKKSNVDKIKKTFGSKSLGMQSVIYGLDKNPKITKADPKAKFIAAANKKKKKVI